jgi:hypothetical protein
VLLGTEVTSNISDLPPSVEHQNGKSPELNDYSQDLPPLVDRQTGQVQENSDFVSTKESNLSEIMVHFKERFYHVFDEAVYKKSSGSSIYF